MRLVKVTLRGERPIAVHPNSIDHVQPINGRPGCLLFMGRDGIPYNTEDDWLCLQAEINDAMGSENTLADLRKEFVLHTTALIAEIRRSQWAFGISALAFIILLLVMLGRTH
jgi:hypothetical protein